MEEFKKKGYYPAGGRSQTSSAGSIVYSNANSGIEAQNVQDAIDEVDSKVDKLEGKFELIEEITLEEDVFNFNRTQTPDGKEYNFKSLVVIVTDNISSAQAGGALYINNENICSIRYYVRTGNTNLESIYCDCSTGRLIASLGNLNAVADDYFSAYLNGYYEMDSITEIMLYGNTYTGANIKIYGIWAD